MDFIESNKKQLEVTQEFLKSSSLNITYIEEEKWDYWRIRVSTKDSDKDLPPITKENSVLKSKQVFKIIEELKDLKCLCVMLKQKLTTSSLVYYILPLAKNCFIIDGKRKVKTLQELEYYLDWYLNK